MSALEAHDLAERKVFKILCLHGLGTNADILEIQTASLRYHLGSETAYDFDFVEGAHPWPAYPGIADVFGPQQTYLSYFDGSTAGAMTSLDELATHLTENGPYDAVMGFSMGGAMVATLLLQPRDLPLDKQKWISARPMVRSAVFLCGTLPVDVIKLQRGEMASVELEDVIGPSGKLCPIDVPTVHAWSPEDVEHRSESKTLARMCDESKRVEIMHNAGHNIPSTGSEITAMAGAIREMLHSLRD